MSIVINQGKIKWCTLKHTKKKREATNEKYIKIKQKNWFVFDWRCWHCNENASVFLFLLNMYILIRNNDKDYRRQRNEFFYSVFCSVVLLLQMILCYNEHYNLRLLTCCCFCCCCCCYCCLSLYKYILHSLPSIHTMNSTTNIILLCCMNFPVICSTYIIYCTYFSVKTCKL